MLFATQVSVGLILTGAVLALVSILQNGDMKDKVGFFGTVLFALGLLILFFCGLTAVSVAILEMLA